MNRALLVGIDEYEVWSRLGGCVNDVNALLPLLEKNADGNKNFFCVPRYNVDRKTLKQDIKQLLAPGTDVALFYFAGHGADENNDVVLVTREGDGGDPGLALSLILGAVAESEVEEVIIILDCCYSGDAGGIPQFGGNVAAVKTGLSLLTASRGDQVAAEKDARGLFSTYLCGALEGGAADVLGKVTMAGVYAYLTECFDPFQQRPTFKANVENLHPLRRCLPAVAPAELSAMHALFPTAAYVLPLDPSYEKSQMHGDTKREAAFELLQKCRAAKLVEPVGEGEGAKHMYWAAVNSMACRLTPLGRLYWSMVEKRMI